jgi:hypothetical protein
MACSSAILGLFFSTSESYISNLADGRVPDEACTVAAGGPWLLPFTMNFWLLFNYVSSWC